MPGSSRRSVLATSITASYVTTFCTVWGLIRTCRTTPVNRSDLYASTVNVPRDQEEDGRLQRCRNGLADVDVPGDHRTVLRRPDVGVLEIHLHLMELGF